MNCRSFVLLNAICRSGAKTKIFWTKKKKLDLNEERTGRRTSMCARKMESCKEIHLVRIFKIPFYEYGGQDFFFIFSKKISAKAEK